MDIEIHGARRFGHFIVVCDCGKQFQTPCRGIGSFVACQYCEAKVKAIPATFGSDTISRSVTFKEIQGEFTIDECRRGIEAVGCSAAYDAEKQCVLLTYDRHTYELRAESPFKAWQYALRSALTEDFPPQ